MSWKKKKHLCTLWKGYNFISWSHQDSIGWRQTQISRTTSWRRRQWISPSSIGWWMNERYFHLIVCQQKPLSCQGSTRMGGLFPCWSASGPDDPQEGLAPYHEVLFLSTYWGQNLWMDWRPCWCTQVVNSLLQIKRICFLGSSVIATMFGISTTLGLGTVQINQGLHLLFPGAVHVTSTSQLAIIWVVTAIATISVITGISSFFWQ